MINEKNFVEEIKKKNEEALCYLIEKYTGLVMSIIRKRLFLLQEEQKECFDDVFLNVWEHIDSFDERKSSFTNWIAGITRYRAIDYLRKYKRQFEEIALEDIPLDGIVAGDDKELLRLMEMEISEETELMLQSLKPEERELFQKLYLEEMTVEEVCKNFQTNPNAIYKRLSRARKRMRELFPERIERKETSK